MIDKLLDYARIALFILLGMTSIMLFEAWQKDHAQTETAALTQPADKMRRMVIALCQMPARQPQ